MIQDAASYLAESALCPKHHVEHTGSIAYGLDFYDVLGRTEEGRALVFHLLSRIVENPTGGRVFYPGHLNPMNMSQNVIDTGTAVDAIARYAHRNRAIFTEQEHATIGAALRDVVESYLAEAAREKQITNQRLWGLTGVASYARYIGEEERYQSLAQESIERAFNDMTHDGFFRYYPNPISQYAPYDGMTTFYQSRHAAFIAYACEALGISHEQYRERYEQSMRALLSMYTTEGYKDMRMECKRWYWLSSYEVASNAFDSYALSHSSTSESVVASHNALVAIRAHFKNKRLNSRHGINLNFQCPIFWTAHLAWMTRVEGIEDTFNHAYALQAFSFELKGKEVYTRTNETERVLVNALTGPRNPTTGLYDTGLQGPLRIQARFPTLPHAFLFSLRENINHAWYALRGGHILEAFVRIVRFKLECLMMLLPLYSVRYGKVLSLSYDGNDVRVVVQPASKYGTQAPGEPISLTV